MSADFGGWTRIFRRFVQRAEILLVEADLKTAGLTPGNVLLTILGTVLKISLRRIAEVTI